MKEEQCVQCGVKRSLFDGILGHNCEGCGAWICPSCFAKLDTVYTPNKTQFGMVGYLKLCSKCYESYKRTLTKIEEHPYIG